MWPELRQRIGDLEEAVRRLGADQFALQETFLKLVEQLSRHKDRQITLEARMDRLEDSPSIRARRGVPLATIPLGGSSSPAAPSGSSGAGS